MENNENNTNSVNNSEILSSFERELIPRVYQCTQTSNFDEALKLIDDFYSLNLEKDEQGWLEKKSNYWKAHIFEKQERYSEALPLYQSAHQSIQLDDDLFGYKKLDIARVLYKLGNYDEAIEQIECVFEQSSCTSPQELLKLLDCYTNCLESSERSFPVEHEKLLNRLENEFNTHLPGNSQLKLEDLKKALEQMIQKNKAANKRYSLLMIEFSQAETSNERINLLRNYISEEKINCYRNLAIEELNEAEG